MKRCQLSDLVIPVNTWNPGKSDPEESFQYIDLSAVDQATKSIVGARDIGCSDAPSRARQLVKAGDILVSTVRPNLNGVAKVPGELNGATASTGFCVVRPNPERLDGSYLFHWVKSDEFISEMVKEATGASYPAVSDRIVLASRIPLPPLPEQRRIAAILDQADALRAKRREALALLDELQRGIFIEMFGDPVTNPKGWARVLFGDVGRLDRGVSKHRPRNAPELLGGDYPLVQTGDVANSGGYIRKFSTTYSDAGLKQSKLWPAGTLCITIAANIAKTGILTFDACFPDSVVGFTADEPSTVEFVRVWLSFLQKSLEDSAPESAQKNINLAILRNLEIPLPPPDARMNFFKAITRLEEARELNQKSLDDVERLLASLQHRAFRGEL